MTYTADDLLRSAKRGITVPNFQALMSDQDILDIATEEIDTVILPMLISLRSEFLVYMTEVPVTQGQKAYDIPYRAVGRKLRELHYRIDPSGQMVRDLPYINPEDAYQYTNVGSTGDPRGFFIQGDKVIVLPTPQATNGFLQMFYEERPGRLIQTTQAAQITAINTGANQVTLTQIPTGVLIGALVDINANAPGNSSVLVDASVSGVSGNVVTITQTLPTNMVVNDWVSLAQTTPILKVPQECMQLLAASVQCRILEAIGDTEAYQITKARFDEKFKQMQILLSPRVEGENMKVINRNSLLRRNNLFKLYTRWF